MQTAWTLDVAAIEKKKKKEEEEEDEEEQEEEEEEEECLLSYVGPPQNNKCIYTGEQVSKSLGVLRPVKHYGYIRATGERGNCSCRR